MKRIAKLISSALTSLLLLNISTPVFAEAPDIKYLRVGLHFGPASVEEYTLTSDGGFIAGTETDRVFTEGIVIEETELTITIDNDGIITYGNNTFDTTSGQRLTIMPADDGFISANGKKYRGGFEFLDSGEGELAVINYISVDDYVKGVVPREVSASWHEEALKAQAVCARNYSISNCNKHSTSGFDVCTTVHCQVYGGMAAEYASTNEAVDATSGEYLMYKGKLAETLFFSSAGGHTGDSVHVWGNAIPYLSGVENNFENPNENPRYSWSLTMSAEQITKILKDKGYEIGDITSIKTKTNDKTGQVYELTVVGTEGNKTYKNDSTRGWLGSDVLYSQFYTVTPISSANKSGITAMSAKGTSTIEGFFAIDGNEKNHTVTSPIIALSSTKQTTLDTGIQSYRFDGRGWGHGLGMSQFGAKGMADKGYTYDEILAHYYPGTNLE